MAFFTSDLHFGHKNIMKFNPHTRPYSSLEDMDEKMIESWNKDVAPGSLVYILGDVSFYKPKKTVEILNNLNGSKILIKGNHDSSNLKDQGFRDCFIEIHDYFEAKIVDRYMCLFHFPIYDWHKIHHGAYHLHGHVHGKHLGIGGRILDVGWDNFGRVVSYDEVVYILDQSEVRVHGAGKN
jgi:calcineurin-like phosphoesterase family protein